MKAIITSFMLILMVGVLWSCKKNEQRLISTTLTDGKAFLKVNYAMPFALNPSVQLKVNGDRVSNLLTYDTPFPGGGLNTGGGNYPDYASVNPGTTALVVSRPNVGTNNDSIILFSGSVSLTAGKNSTVHIADTGANAAAVVIEDNVSPIDSGKSRYVFVNLIPNSSVDLYYGTTSTTTPLATNIPYKGKSSEFTVVAGSTGSWYIRAAGVTPTTTNTLASYSNTIPNQRVMTVFSRGYITTPATTGTRAPAISLIYNR